MAHGGIPIAAAATPLPGRGGSVPGRAQLVYVDGHHIWAHDRGEERAAFEVFIDYVIAALAEDPRIHVYHYAPYEPSALKRLMGRHGTRSAISFPKRTLSEIPRSSG